MCGSISTFLLFLELLLIIMYGTLSSVSCLAVVNPNDATDLLDPEMWEECGPVALGNFCLGFLIFILFFLKLTAFETGLMTIKDLMTLNIPRGLKVVTFNLCVMGSITLYFQAATNFHMGLWIAFTLFGIFMAFVGPTIIVVGLTLPLKALAAGLPHGVAKVARDVPAT